MTETIQAPTTTRPLLLAGTFTTSPSEQPVTYPYDGSTIATVALANDEIVDSALTRKSGMYRRSSPSWV